MPGSVRLTSWTISTRGGPRFSPTPLVSIKEAAQSQFLVAAWLYTLDVFLPPRLAVPSDCFTPHRERAPTPSKDALVHEVLALVDLAKLDFLTPPSTRALKAMVAPNRYSDFTGSALRPGPKSA